MTQDPAHCQGLISGARTKVAVQSASNTIQQTEKCFIPFSKFIQSAIFIHFNFEAAYKYKLSASSRDINNADSASEENVNKVETESQIPSILIFCLLLARAGNFVHSN